MEDPPARPPEPPADREPRTPPPTPETGATTASAEDAPKAPPKPEAAPQAGSEAGGTAPGTTPGSATATASEVPGDAADGPPAAAATPAASARRLPRGSTSVLIAAAALLGIVAGVATGYTVQAEREPTPLPPLSQRALSYPDRQIPANEWEPVPAKHDRRVRTDGDLRRLLVKKPEGARTPDVDAGPDDGWVPLQTYIREYREPDHMFELLVERHIRRVAGADWETGQYRTTVIRLVQFNEETNRYSELLAGEQQEYMPDEEFAGAAGEPLRGSGNGLYFVDRSPDREPGYLPAYNNRAIAARGDIMMDITIYDTQPVSEKAIRDLAERQWERL